MGAENWSLPARTCQRPARRSALVIGASQTSLPPRAAKPLRESLVQAMDIDIHDAGLIGSPSQGLGTDERDERQGLFDADFADLVAADAVQGQEILEDGPVIRIADG